jgi:hypothetical protein
VLSGVKIAQKLGYIKEYRWSFGIDDLVATVGYLGPVILGIPWYKGMGSPDSQGKVSPTGTVVGGHAILCNGVNVKRKTFRLHNSWGEGWGLNGDCIISWKDLDFLLHNGGEAVIPVSRSTGK